MSLALNNKIVTNGLIFCVDQSNVRKSWIGPPTTNQITYSQNFAVAPWVGYQASITANTAETYDPFNRNTAYKLAASTSGSTYSFINYNYSAGSTTTFSIYAKKGEYGRIGISNRSSNTFGAIFDLVNGTVVNTWNGTGTITSTGISPIGGGWYRVWVTSSATNQYNVHPLPDAEGTASNLNNVSTLVAGYGIYIYGAQLEAYSFPTPLVTTSGATASRSTTQSVLDMTGNCTNTVSSLTYNNDGTFSFNGTSDYIDLGRNCAQLGLSLNATFDVWIYPTSTGAMYGISDWNVDGITLRTNSNASADFYIYPNNYRITYSYSFNPNVWYNLVGVANGSTMYMFLNGQQVASTALGNAIGSSPSTLKIGSRGDAAAGTFGTGKVGMVKIYNRALSSGEILQNFNAHRSRYGI